MTDMNVWYVLFNATEATGMCSWLVICIWRSVELINNYALKISEFLWHLLALHIKGRKGKLSAGMEGSVRVT